ncbi:hypothetical protein HMPREF0653_01664 [Prevotella disiens JCM 6334 = ATCC 29426]|uniref:Uncharacterized protein n=1 Tax=Prevotella disiens JCM 6334 = ATCC 29426 TaxID=1235811 RepID=A0ABN0NR59_9BACT|nr:hypothetical protein HMPREF0653_01664 [Prevotella disiens JCM 6334 = ATCC 29426]
MNWLQRPTAFRFKNLLFCTSKQPILKRKIGTIRFHNEELFVLFPHKLRNRA